MADPVRSTSSAAVITGDPTRVTHYVNLRSDVLRALTELDYGTTGEIPGTPATGQKFMDTTLDEVLVSFDGSTFTAIASSNVVINTSGISVDYSATSLLGGGAVAPVGADRWVTV